MAGWVVWSQAARFIFSSTNTLSGRMNTSCETCRPGTVWWWWWGGGYHFQNRHLSLAGAESCGRCDAACCKQERAAHSSEHGPESLAQD